MPIVPVAPSKSTRLPALDSKPVTGDVVVASLQDAGLECISVVTPEVSKIFQKLNVTLIRGMGFGVVAAKRQAQRGVLSAW
jgi:hypothetical protein